VVGAGGAIKLKREAGLEQRTRLEMEGVRFRGKRVDLVEHQHRFRTWELED
jgi:methylated-DNA-protein-cysteine methyltransferase-like protein